MIKANINEIELRDKIIKLALLQHHKKYVHGSHGPDTFDCAGLVWYIYNEVLGIDIYKGGFGLSTTTKIMTSNYGKLILFDESNLNKDFSLIKIGDIVLFHRQSLKDIIPKENNKYPGHSGIYLGNNRFIHCSRPKGKVVINNFLKTDYWNRVLVASKNIVDDLHYVKKYNR